MKWFFLIWGLGGFIICFVAALVNFAQPSMSGLTQVSVGILFWIGGMIFFGVSHLITVR